MNKKDVFGQALYDFYRFGRTEPLLLHTSYQDIEEMPLDVFFRDNSQLPELEQIALALCDGNVLDVGAGAGSHALELQQKNMEVTALDHSKLACQVITSRGVNRVINADFFGLENSDIKYDTLLFLMNGIGLSGTIQGLEKTLQIARKILYPGGQIIFDSSDISYLYDDYGVKKPAHYPGIIEYQYEYKNEMGVPFEWLYIDQEELIKVADKEKWLIQIVYEDENSQYLARMSML